MIEGTPPALKVLRIARSATRVGSPGTEISTPRVPGASAASAMPMRRWLRPGGFPLVRSPPSRRARLMREGVLHAVAAARTRRQGHRLAGRRRRVQVARVTGRRGTSSRSTCWSTRPGQDGFIRDDRIDARRIACLPRQSEGPLAASIPPRSARTATGCSSPRTDATPLSGGAARWRTGKPTSSARTATQRRHADLHGACSARPGRPLVHRLDRGQCRPAAHHAPRRLPAVAVDRPGSPRPPVAARPRIQGGRRRAFPEGPAARGDRRHHRQRRPRW